MLTQHTHLGEHLVNAGLMNQEQIRTALHLQHPKGGFLGQIFVTEGWITGQQLCQALSQMLRIHWTNLDCLLIGQDTLQLVPRSVAIIWNVLPIFVLNGVLHVAMEDPCDAALIEFVEFRTGMQVKPMLAPVKQLQEMIRKYYMAESA